MKKKHAPHSHELKEVEKDAHNLFEKSKSHANKQAEHTRASTSQYLKGGHSRGRSGRGR